MASTVTLANQHEQMMQGMLQMQRCMTENVDASYLEKMAKNSEVMANKIEQLCQAGQRQHAQDIAMDYALKMQKDSNFQAMQNCMAQMGGALPGAQTLQEDFDLDALNKNHVCDEL
jgi:DNA-binding FadR family transcriptional regulator